VRAAVDASLDLLDRGTARVAEKRDGRWQVNEWLKKAVLLSFRIYDNQVVNGASTRYYDKVPLKFASYDDARFRAEGVRIVPPATVRRGAHVAKNAVLMPSYVNVGAFIGEGTMVDTWATVGSCAQIGRNVHLSGGVGIGGVLEPLQATPTIVEDDCFIGARSEIVEGVIVEQGAVISMGVYIGQSTRIYDRERDGSCRPRLRARLRLNAAGAERQVRPLLRRHRQACRCADTSQDRHQRVAACGRLTACGEARQPCSGSPIM
jgi:2,3,4,5-tetrahydropyridine-2-carboxylate N-succinyltransferase